jgi:meso-butanediol dehydrogenase / (S,S)-butanediol dehydrogenase / diacetyl reductase
MGLLDGKVAIVTAAGQGIGLATVERFVAEGARVVCVSRDAEALAGSLAELPEGWVAAVAGDAGEEATAARAVGAAREAFGGLDVLVNGVGMAAFGDVTEVDPERWEQVLRTNVTSAYLFARAAIPAMRERGGGAIVSVSSLQGTRGDWSSAAYATSKAALDNMTRAMALDHGADGIRVNAVAPGFIETPRTAAVPAERLDGILRVTPLGRTGRAAEVAAAIAFLASAESSYVTGAILPVDGGRLASVGSPR